MSEWIEWSGGECPVKVGTLVDVKLRDGDYGTRLHAGLPSWEEDSEGYGMAEIWQHDGMDGDIVAYRLSPEKSE
ncbi:hypothetical protein [Modicisalibacter coralii]|uniref:hypothetical protein n=1 Tax=Modicisalibacter coralii TaxID=2304602 RepID=UPI00100AEBBA|nr:hypothetical protein [Halomonas coralii]